MDQTDEFAASLLIVRQVASMTLMLARWFLCPGPRLAQCD